MVVAEKRYPQRHFSETDRATRRNQRRSRISRMALGLARDNSGRRDGRRLFRRMHLNSMLAISKTNDASEIVTINSLKATTRWYVNIVAIWAKQLHCVQSRQIRTSTRHNITAQAVYPRTDAKYARFVFFDLK